MKFKFVDLTIGMINGICALLLVYYLIVNGFDMVVIIFFIANLFFAILNLAAYFKEIKEEEKGQNNEK